MLSQTAAQLYRALDELVLIDPHTHINPLAPASTTLADIMGYHYYTELAHSAGLPKDQIEGPGITPREKVRRLVMALEPIENTIQYSWLIELSQKFFGFTSDRLSVHNWEELYDAAEAKMAEPTWADHVLKASRIESLFLTNDFDDPLAGFDTNKYIPCLRTDDLVFHLAKPEVLARFAKAIGGTPTSSNDVTAGLKKLFQHFLKNNVRACAISLPPDFTPTQATAAGAAAVDEILHKGTSASPSSIALASTWIFWQLAEGCAEYKLPFDLMIGVNRNVYPNGVHQGRDLYDSRVSLIQYRELFNAFPTVTFPVSVLASVTNQELVSYSWIFPNVVCNGHWWYSNTPVYIAHDLAARLEAAPQTKTIGYYSDAYKLEFIWPKFAMFKRVLATVLADNFVEGRGWSEEQAFELGRRVLRGNVEQIFPARSGTAR